MRKLRTLLALSAAALIATSAMAVGAILNVDTTVDGPGLTACDDATPNDCSLRGAIIKANGLSEAVTINVPAGRYILSQATACSFRGNDIGVLFSALGLCPTGNLTIVGAGAGATIIDANQPPVNNVGLGTVLFVATTANITFHGVTIRGGNYSVSTLIGTGGGINNAGTLTLVDSVVTENWSAGSGGGIFNQGTLTLRRTQVTRNAAGDGAGIFSSNLMGTCQAVSPCHEGQGVISIVDSTLSDNAASGLGGAIFNSVGMIDISGSTISGNVAIGGGGIYNAAWNIDLTNVTVSGNRARIGGGLLNTGPSYSTIHMNNVTIANNTAQDLNDPTVGLGGGLWNGASASATIANTIIAGNFAPGSCGINGCVPGGNDCVTDAPHGGPLTSQGYNLVQDTQECDIVGETTGNITGQGAKLGILTDNGGLGFTQALASDSPAVDAGNPAIPGSGGAACAVTDERGFLRPIGGRCDIGAFERSAAFSIANILPGSGGNTGQVTAHIGGGGFVDGAAITLRRSGQSDIVGARTQVDVGGSSIATTFDLTSAAPGAWDVVVTNPDSSSTTLAGGFTVKAGVGPSVWVDVVGIIRRQGPSTIVIVYGNRGDADALGVPLSLSLPSVYPWTRFFDITPPPLQPDEQRPDWTLISELVGLPGQPGFLQAPLFLPLVPSGFTGVLRFNLTLPADATDTLMFAAVGDAVITPQTETAFIDQAVAGTQTFTAQRFGVTVPDSVMSQLRQYATTQLHTMIANGQAAFTASLGTVPQVYSLDQLQMDLFFFIAPRVPSAHAASF